MANNGVRDFDWSSIGQIFKTGINIDENNHQSLYIKELKALYNGDDKLWPTTPTFSSLTIIQNPTKTVYDKGETFDRTGIQLELSYTNGSSDIILDNDSALSHSPSTITELGYQSITFRYEDQSQVATTQLTNTIWGCGLEINKSSINDYYVNDVFNRSYYTVTYYNNNETIIDLSDNIDVTFEIKINGVQINENTPFDSAGTLSITARYNGYEATITDTIYNYSLKSIYIDNLAEIKTNYITGENFDLTNLRIIATYDHHTNETIWDNNGPTANHSLNQFEFNPVQNDILNNAGINTAIINYTENGITKSYSFNIYVKGIKVTRKPKISYFWGETFDITNCEVTFFDDAGAPSVLDIWNDVVFNPAHSYLFTTSDISDNYNVTITYIDENNITYLTSFTIQIQDILPIQILLKTYPKTWEKGVQFNISDFWITVRYNNGSVRDVQCSGGEGGNTSISPSQITTTGWSSRITVSYTEKGVTKTTTFTCWIKGLSVDNDNTKKNYYIGDNFDISQCKIDFYNFDDINNEPLVQNVTTSCVFTINTDTIDNTHQFTKADNFTINVFYTLNDKTYTTNFNISVTAAVLVSIQITQEAQNIYDTWENLDLSNLQLDLVYNSGNRVSINFEDSNLSFSLNTQSISHNSALSSYVDTYGTYSLAISYDNSGSVFTTFQSIHIKGIYVVDTLHNYVVGDAFNSNNYEIYYYDGNQDNLIVDNIDCTFDWDNGDTFDSATSYQIHITYEPISIAPHIYTTTLEIMVGTIYPIRLEITQDPFKILYKTEESLSLTGLELNVIWNNNNIDTYTSENLTGDFSFVFSDNDNIDIFNDILTNDQIGPQTIYIYYSQSDDYGELHTVSTSFNIKVLGIYLEHDPQIVYMEQIDSFDSNNYPIYFYDGDASFQVNDQCTFSPAFSPVYRDFEDEDGNLFMSVDINYMVNDYTYNLLLYVPLEETRRQYQNIYFYRYPGLVIVNGSYVCESIAIYDEYGDTVETLTNDLPTLTSGNHGSELLPYCIIKGVTADTVDETIPNADCVLTASAGVDPNDSSNQGWFFYAKYYNRENEDPLEANDGAGVFCDGQGTDGSDVCLSADTLITMFDKSQKQLKDIKVGDLLFSYNYQQNQVCKIQNSNYTSSHIIYYFSNGITIDETGPHRFFNIDQGFWVPLREWKIGDRGKTLDNQCVKLISKEVKYEIVEQFGLWTTGHEYYANNLLSGDIYANIKMLKDGSALLAAKIFETIPITSYEKTTENWDNFLL